MNNERKTTTDGRLVYEVRVERYEELCGRITKLNRRAARLVKRGYEASPVVLEVLEENVRCPGRIDETTGFQKPDFFIHRVAVSGVTPKAAGWVFAATLQHDEGGTIIRRVPNVVVSEEVFKPFRNATPVCEHCKTDRNRKDTFVLVNAEVVKQVGRKCLQDFLGGISPEAIVAGAEILATAGELLGDAEEGFGEGFGGGARVYALDTYLTYVACAIRTDGWLSRTAAREVSHGCATADLAVNFGIDPPRGASEKSLLRPTDEDKALAAEALARSDADLNAEGADLSEYEHNLRVVVNAEVVSYKTLGLAASLIVYHQRKIGREVARKAEAARNGASVHFGTVGKREVFTLTVERVFDYEGNYGVVHIHTLRDPSGNVAVWFSSGTCLQVGNTYALKATVKVHEERKGTKQTVLSRCSVQVHDAVTAS